MYCMVHMNKYMYSYMYYMYCSGAQYNNNIMTGIHYQRNSHHLQDKHPKISANWTDHWRSKSRAIYNYNYKLVCDSATHDQLSLYNDAKLMLPQNKITFFILNLPSVG